jgi:hypothetical protein
MKPGESLKIGDLVCYGLVDFNISGLGIIVKISERISGFGAGTKKKNSYHVATASSLYIFDLDHLKKIDIS